MNAVVEKGIRDRADKLEETYKELGFDTDNELVQLEILQLASKNRAERRQHNRRLKRQTGKRTHAVRLLLEKKEARRARKAAAEDR